VLYLPASEETRSDPDDLNLKFKLNGWDTKLYIAVNLVVLKVPVEPAVCRLLSDKKAASEDDSYVSVLITLDAYLSVDWLSDANL